MRFLFLKHFFYPQRSKKSKRSLNQTKSLIKRYPRGRAKKKLFKKIKIEESNTRGRGFFATRNSCRSPYSEPIFQGSLWKELESIFCFN